MKTEIIILLITLLLVYITFFINDLVKTKEVKYFPKWVWAIICFITIPLGGVLYYLFGKGSK